MKYLCVADAKNRPGLRLVLTVGVPGPWSESAKAVLHAHRVSFLAVAQQLGEPNEALRAWTGVRNAPVAVLDDEPPLTGWLDILMLAESLGSGPSLLPDRSVDRMRVLGIAAEICGRDGLGWNRRLSMMGAAQRVEPPADASPHVIEIMKAYGVNARTVARADARTVDILAALAVILHDQRARGSKYLVGRSLTAADLYWACFSQLIDPLPQDVNPMPEDVRSTYSTVGPAVRAAMTPNLLEHRDLIYREHIGLPLDY